MFGMTTATSDDGNTGICMKQYNDGAIKYARLCSSYSNYITFNDAL